MRFLRRIALVLALLALVAGGSSALAAERELGGFVPVGLRPDFLATGAGEDETFVFATSTSSYKLSVVDTSLFEDLGPFDFVADTTTRSRGLSASPDGVFEGIVAVASNDGYVDFFYLSDLELMSQTGVAPSPDFHEADLDNEPLAGLAIDATSTRTFAGVVADETVAINTINNGFLSGTVFLAHAPVSAMAVNTGLIERVFFGCDDGFLAWVDTGTLNPAAVDIAADLTHSLTVMARADFGGSATRLLVLDGTDDTLYVIDPAAPATPVDSAALGANAVALASSGSGTSARIYVAFDDAVGGHRIEVLDTTLANAQPDITLPAAPRSLVERDGRLYVGLTDNRIAVVSDLPFVEITSVSPSPLPVADADVSVTFVSSQSGTARVFLNGDELESVAVTADVPATVTLPASGVEGVIDLGLNRVRVEVNATGGLIGHDESSLVFDEAPGAPRNFEVGFGDGRVIGRWDSPSGANDVDHYVVYFGTSATDSNGAGSQTSPADEEGQEYVVNVSNGTTVFMSVLAVDSGGNSSARTTVKSATAQDTVGAADLAGEDGGFLCSVGGLDRASAPFFAAMVLGLATLVARRLSHRRGTTS